MGLLTIHVAYALAAAKWQREKKLAAAPVNQDFPLADLLATLAQTYALSYRGVEARPSVKYTGYVEIQHKDGTVYFPYNLSTFFPFASTLDELIKCTGSMRLADVPVCISGSATFLAQPLAVGDLDFCTYLDRSCPKVLERAEQMWNRERPFCVTVKWDDRQADRGASDVASVLAAAKAALDAGGFEPGQRWKLDFVAETAAFGTLPLSVYGIPIDPADPGPWIAGYSWTFQEAAVTTATDDMAVLVRPDQLGDYGLWLRAEAAKYLPKAPVKSAKRTLSLTSLLLMAEETDAVLEALTSAELRSLVERTALRDAVDLLAASGSAAGAGLLAEASKTLTERGGEPQPDEYLRINSECAKVVSRALASVDSALDKGREALEATLR